MQDINSDADTDSDLDTDSDSDTDPEADPGHLSNSSNTDGHETTNALIILEIGNDFAHYYYRCRLLLLL